MFLKRVSPAFLTIGSSSLYFATRNLIGINSAIKFYLMLFYLCSFIFEYIEYYKIWILNSDIKCCQKVRTFIDNVSKFVVAQLLIIVNVCFLQNFPPDLFNFFICQLALSEEACSLKINEFSYKRIIKHFKVVLK